VGQEGEDMSETIEVQLHGWVNITVTDGVATHISLDLSADDTHNIVDEDGDEVGSLDRVTCNDFSEIAYLHYPDKDIHPHLDDLQKWWEEVISYTKFPSGLDHVDPELMGDILTRLLTGLQLMNKDAYQAGLAAAEKAS
jgi:hypothetical protein